MTPPERLKRRPCAVQRGSVLPLRQTARYVHLGMARSKPVESSHSYPDCFLSPIFTLIRRLMEPFSITAGAIGITDAAVSSIDSARRLINSIREAKDVVSDIATGLENIQYPLASVSRLLQDDDALSVAARQDLKSAGVAEAVNECGKACESLSKDLKKWTRHSNNAKLSFRDQVEVSIWNKEKIRTYRMRIQSCSVIVGLAVQSAQL